MSNIPDAPAYLKPFPRAVERWNELWSVMETSRINAKMHGDLVAAYCINYSDMREAMDKMAHSKLVGDSKLVGEGEKAKKITTNVRVSPYQAIFDKAVQNMERLGKQIGLDPENPLSRARPWSEYAEFLGDDDDDGTGNAGDAGESSGDGGSEQPGTDAEGEVRPGAADQTKSMD